MSRAPFANLRELALRSRWFSAGVIALLVFLVLIFELAPLPQPFSGFGGTVDNLLRSLFTAAMLATLAYVWFYFWTGERAARFLLRTARESPEKLFSNPAEAGAELIYGRGELVEEIAAALRHPTANGPQIVVGMSGAGKTTLLLALAAHLASKKKRVLPIVLSLRDPDNDLGQQGFTELAIRRFREQIDPHIKTDAEADKVWRWMRNRDQIVVLADDLDRSTATDDPYRTQVRLALETAGRRNLPLVVATRPSGLPPDLPEPQIELSQRQLASTSLAPWEYVLWRAGRGTDDPEAGQRAKAYIEAGGLVENAFYLVLLARLLRAEAIEKEAPRGKHDARLALLDAEHDRLTGKQTMHPVEVEQREQALAQVERLAAAWLSPKSKREFEPRWLNAIHEGERFGLLSLDEQGRPQFQHEVLHAYYASRAIAEGDAGWRGALQRSPNSPRVQLALILAATRRSNPDFCRSACQVLLAGTKAITADQRLLRAAAAAEIARAGDFGELDEEIATRCAIERPRAGSVVKHFALDQLGHLGGGSAVRALWGYGNDNDYEVRWAAIKRVVDRCSAPRPSDLGEARPPVGVDAYAELDPMIEQALAIAEPMLKLEEEDRLDDWAPEIVELKLMAWLLPALRTATEGMTRERIDGHLKSLLHLDEGRVTMQRGLEASIAQGFKLDAMLHREVDPDVDALEMLGRAAFWYSQLNLVHAWAVRAAYTGSRPDALRAKLAEIAAIRPLHPLMKYAADLSLKGLERVQERGPAEIGRWIWDDEGVVVSEGPADLAPEAAQLVGEIVVLLNLNESGSFERRRKFGEGRTMPYCLSASRDRAELTRGCHAQCELRLCPYQPVRDRLSAHREMSRTFCRDQRFTARTRVASSWGSSVRSRSLAEFWKKLESRAQF